MANHIINDQGETVVAVGAPGSIERLKAEYPLLISGLNEDNFIYMMEATDFSLLEIKNLIEIVGVEESLNERLCYLSGVQLDRPQDLTWDEVAEIYTLSCWLY